VWFARRDLGTLKEELMSMSRKRTRKRMKKGNKKSKRDTRLFRIYWQKE